MYSLTRTSSWITHWGVNTAMMLNNYYNVAATVNYDYRHLTSLLLI